MFKKDTLKMKLTRNLEIDKPLIWIPSKHLLVQSQQYEHQNNVSNMFNGVILVSLSLTLNIFPTFF